MSQGVYGINIPSNISYSDVDLYYSFNSDRTVTNSENSTFVKLNSNLLVKAKKETDTTSTMSGDTII